MTGPGAPGRGVVPRGPGRSLAAAAALVLGAAAAAAALRPPVPPFLLERGEPEPPPPGGVPPGARLLLLVVGGLASPDPVVRRESAGVVERIAADPDPGARLALAGALAALGGRAARLPLLLLAGDGDRAVRTAARRALLEGEGRPGEGEAGSR